MGWGFSASSVPEHAATTRAVCEVQQTISGESARKADIAPRHLNYCKAGRRAMAKVCFRPGPASQRQLPDWLVRK